MTVYIQRITVANPEHPERGEHTIQFVGSGADARGFCEHAERVGLIIGNLLVIGAFPDMDAALLELAAVKKQLT